MSQGSTTASYRICLPRKHHTLIHLAGNPFNLRTMPGKKVAGEGSKKAQGQARKAEAAAGKKAVKEQEVAKAEDQEWAKGSKDSSKKYASLLDSPATTRAGA